MEFLSKASFVVLKAEKLALFGWRLARCPCEGLDVKSCSEGELSSWPPTCWPPVHQKQEMGHSPSV